MNVGYRFGPFVVDPKRRALTRDGAPVAVTPKAFDILLYLVQHPNRIVTKQDLMKAAWPDSFVEEGNLTQNVSLLRKALGQTGDDQLVVLRSPARVTNSRPTSLTSSPLRPSWSPFHWHAREVLAPSGLHGEGTLPSRRAVLVVLGGAWIVWQRSRAGLTGENPVRLAVLPFANLTGDSTEEYLAGSG